MTVPLEQEVSNKLLTMLLISFTSFFLFQAALKLTGCGLHDKAQTQHQYLPVADITALRDPL